VLELQHYFQTAAPGQVVRAVPGAGLNVPIWLLGSSLFSAQLAALLGLPYAFASHFAPDDLMAALELYRSKFRPSAALQNPYAMAGIGVFASETDREAELLFTSVQQQFVNLRRGQPGRLIRRSSLVMVSGPIRKNKTLDTHCASQSLVHRKSAGRNRRVHQENRRG